MELESEGTAAEVDTDAATSQPEEPKLEDFYKEDRKDVENDGADDNQSGDDVDLEGLDEDAEAGEGEDIPPAPHSWSKEDAEAWKALTPEAREVVLRREKERDKFVAEAGRKAADQRREVERQALEAVAQHADNYARQLQEYASVFLPQQPDANLLYTGRQEDYLAYQQQDAAYRAAQAQQQQLQQRIALSQQQAEQAREQAMSAESQAEAERLREEVPEFFDPDTGPKLRQSLESIGQELGYSAELMSQAGATDILALRKASEWRDKAAKYDKLMSKRMESVRAAKTLPPRVARPGSAVQQQQNTPIEKLLYPND